MRESKDTTASKSRADTNNPGAAQQIQAMSWEDIFQQAEKPISRKEMLKDLQQAKAVAVAKKTEHPRKSEK